MSAKAWCLHRRQVYLKATQSLKSTFRLRRPKLPAAFSDFQKNRKQPPPPNSLGTTDVYCICDRARSVWLVCSNQIQCVTWLRVFRCAVRMLQIKTELGQKKTHVTCEQVGGEGGGRLKNSTHIQNRLSFADFLQHLHSEVLSSTSSCVIPHDFNCQV